MAVNITLEPKETSFIIGDDYRKDNNIKFKIKTGHRMIAIYNCIFIINFTNRNNHYAILRLGLKFHTGFDNFIWREVGKRNFKK